MKKTIITLLLILTAASSAFAMKRMGDTFTLDGIRYVVTTAASSSGANDPSASGNLEIVVNGNIDVGPNATDETQEASVTFSRFPKNYKEFTAAYATLKQSPQGAVAAELMAMEMYRRNRSNGEKEGSNYARPYQVASFLAG